VTYQDDVVAVTEDRVVTVARQWPYTKVCNDTRLREVREGTVEIDVEIGLTAPAPLFAYAFRQARTAHLALGTRLRAVLDADSTG
jgi:hypothetical protein